MKNEANNIISNSNRIDNIRQKSNTN